MSEVEDSAAAVKEMVGEFGSLYGLVNNAGIVIDNLTLRYKESDFDQIFSVNTKGSFFLIKEALRPMMKNRDSGAAIVNLSSVVGQMGGVGQVPYSATKGAVISMTKSLAREYAAKNIRVNGVAPGFIETDMTNDLTEDAKKMMLDNIPLKRTAQAEEVAWGVKFLLSPKASYITGHILNINGGLYI